jgi:ectoine hydroxylase-related dioxygenase (phytanoyl-CoA dioxygenase family)
MSEFSQQFCEDGYALARGVFQGEELAQMQEDFDRIVLQILSSGEDVNAKWDAADRMGAADTVVLHTHNVQQYSGVWLRALMSESYLARCREILGPDVILHHSKLFQKPAEKGAPFPMHQDWPYFPTLKNTMCAAVIHLSDATDEMGCLRVVPGSHKLGRLERSSGSEAEFDRKFGLDAATPIEAQAGDVVFFNYLTVHGSKPNRSQRTRKTVLVQMHAGDDDVEPGVAHPNERLVLSGWNGRATRDLANR